MKKTLLIILTIVICAVNAFSQPQVSSYSFTSTSGTFSAITGGTVLGTGAFDDNVYGANNIGFTFTYNGTNYTTFSVDANGWIAMGSSAINSYTPLSSGSTNNCIAAVAYDLVGLTTGEIRYQVIGSAPTRTCVIQFLHVAKYTSGTGDDFSFQVRLNETTNTIDIVYGSFTVNTTSATVQVGIGGATFADYKNRTTTTNWAATTAGSSNVATCTLSNTVYPSSGLTFSFAPPPPCSAPGAQPTTLVLTPSLSTIAGSFTAAAAVDEYLVIRSLSNTLSATPVNGVRYAVGSSFGGGVVDNYGATTFTSTTLSTGTTYYYYIFSANDLTCSGGPLYLTTSPLTGNTTTLTPGNILSTGTGGLWSATTTWVGGVVPTATDNVTIVNGATVTIDVTTATCWHLNVGQGTSGILTYINTPASTLTVNDGIDIAAGASLTAGAGALTTHALYVGGNLATSPGNGSLTNAGTFDMYTTAGVVVSFFGYQNATISGAGSFDYYRVVLNKGNVTATSTVTPPILDLQSTFTIMGANTNSFLYTLTAGVLKISGTFTKNNVTFPSASYSIPAIAGIWLNNQYYTITGQAGSPTTTGLFRVTAGTYNIGTSTGNSMGSGTGGVFIIEGGTINVTGRFNLTSTGVYYNQSGGVLTVQTVGNASGSNAGFGITSSTGTTWIMSGGTIIIQNANTASTPYNDYVNVAGNRTFTGGTLQFGNSSITAATTYRIYGYAPNVVIDGTYANVLKNYYYTDYNGDYVIIYGNLTINSGTTFNCNGNHTYFYGSTLNNNGAILGTSTYNRFDFGAATAQTYNSPLATGTFGTAAAPFAGVGVGFGNTVSVTLNAPIVTTRVNLFTGSCINSGQITIGNAGSSTGYIQRGGGAGNPAGAFDVVPVFNVGTGGLTLSYYTASTGITEGFEVPASRTMLNLVLNNANGLTLTGGDITVGTSSAGVLALTSGVLNTGGSAINLLNTAGAVSGGSPSSYVNGKLSLVFAASRSTTGTYSATTSFYPIGVGSTYLPIYVDPNTGAGGTVTISGQAFLTNSGTMGSGVTSLSAHRWEALVTSGSANLTNAYVKLGDASIVSGNQILQASAAAGIYGPIASTCTFAAGSPNTLYISSNPLLAAAFNGYFAYGNVTPCSAPTAQPTAFVVTYKTSTGFVGSWTAASPAPSNYLVVRYATGATPTNPVNYTVYSVGGALGTGTVRYTGNLTTFTESGLTAGVAYDYYVYSFNNSGCYGPVYLTTSPLTATVTTCSPAVGVPGTPTASNLAPTGFTASWTASSTSGVSYILDVALNGSFTSFVPGYQALNVGIGTLTYNIAGLSANTNYYVRVMAYDNTSCYSAYSFTLNVLTPCNPISSLPWSENFDGMTTIGNSILPTCWSWSSTSGTPWYSGNAASNTYNDPCSSPNYVYVNYSPYSSIDKFLITPGFALNASVSYDFKFKWVGDGYAGWTGDVFYNTVPSGTGATQVGTSFVVSSTITTNSCTLATYRLVAPSTGTYYFMIRVRNTVAPYDLGFDDFSLALSPPCLPPTGLTTSNVTTNSADLNWAAGGTETTWNIKWGLTGFDPSTGGTLISGLTSKPYTLFPAPSGLTPNTTYDWYVMGDCGGSKSTSTWAGPATFKTLCPAVTTFPFTESFDGTTFVPDCWTLTQVSGTGNWARSTGGSYPTTSPHTGAGMAYFNSFNYSAGVTSAMSTPAITFPTGSYEVKFWMVRDSGFPTDDDLVKVMYNTAPSVTGATLLGTINRNITLAPVETGADGWYQYTMTLPSGSGYTYYIIFEAVSAYGNNMYVDDIRIDIPPACPAPTSLYATPATTSALAGWTSAAPTFAIEYGLTGFTPTGTPSAGYSSVSNPATISALSPSTTYDYYVRADCGGSKVLSSWEGPLTFTTLCAAVSAPHCEPFQNTVIPDCWSMSGQQSWLFTTTWPYYGASGVTDHTGTGGSFAGVDGSGGTGLTGITLTSGLIDVSGLTSPQLDFWVFNNNTSTTNINDEQQLVVNVMNGATSIATYTWDYGVNFSTWQEVVLPFTKPSGNQVSLRFVVNKGTANPFYDDMIIDDVCVKEAPPCSVPTSLWAGPNTTTADVGWTSPASTFDIEYGLTGFSPTGTPSPGYSGVSNPATIASLTPATTYDYYVRANCGVNGYSTWAGPKTFTTLCLTATLPICEYFSSPTYPVCWSHQLAGAITSEHWLISNSSNAGGSAYEAEASYSPGQGTVVTDQDRMVSPAINITGLSAIQVTFKQMLDDYAAGNNDVWIKVQYSTDKSTWTDAWSYAGGLGNPIAAETKSLVIPVSGTKIWIAWTLAGNTFDINYWYVDDICIQSALTHDVGTTSIGLAGIVAPSLPVTPTATVYNYGANTETFDVTMTITGGYSSTKTVTSLATGSGTTVTFDAWTPALGVKNVQVCTNLSGDLNAANDCMAKAVIVKVPLKIYACVAYDPTSTLPAGPAYFYDNTPGTIYSLAAETSTNFISAGSWVNGQWYGSEYYDNTVTPATGGGWYTIDPATGAMTLVAYASMGFTGLAYDHANNILYGMNYSVAGTNDLYTVVPATGAATLIGTVSALAGDLAIDIGYSGDGFIYASCIGSDHLYKINTTTLAATDIGALGYNLNYAQGMGYDYTSGLMYLAACTSSGQLMTVSLSTGAAAVAGNFQGNAEMDGVAIPYSAVKTLNLTYTFLEGLFAGEGAMAIASDCDGPHFQADTADIITIELHNNANYGTVAYSTNTALKQNGTATVIIPGDKNDSYYLTLKNRSTIETTSTDPVNFSGEVINYAFDMPSKAYGDNLGLMIDGTAVFYSGDENQDGIVDGSDLSDIGNLASFAECGYIPQDLNGDGLIDGSDLSICGNNAAFAIMINLP